MKTRAVRYAMPLLFGAALAAPAHAGLGFENIETSLQYAYALSSSEDKALGYGADSNRLETLRFQHESDYNWGSNFFLFDFLWSDEPLGGPVFGPYDPENFQYGPGKSTYFSVAGTEALASRVFGYEDGKGFFKDAGLSARYEKGGYYQFRAFEIGPQVHLNVPGFDRFKITAWRRWKSDISGSAGEGGFDVGERVTYRPHWMLGLDWRTSWEMFGLTWSSQMFLRYQVKDGGKAGARGSENINGIPERWWIEPDIFVHVHRHVAVGMRAYYLWQSDAIDNGFSTVGSNGHIVPQLVLKAAFY